MLQIYHLIIDYKIALIEWKIGLNVLFYDLMAPV